MTLAEVKKYLNKAVMYDGDRYTFKACLLFLDAVHGEFKYSARIVSEKTRSVVEVPLDKIKGECL